MIISFLLFLIAIHGSFYLPGLLFLNILGVKLQKFEQFIVSWITGVCLFLLSSYFLAWLHGNGVLPFLLGVPIAFFLWKRKNPFELYGGFKEYDYLSLALILFGSLSFLSITFSSGLAFQSGITFFGLNSVDGMEHLSRIKNQTIFFPPTHPGLAFIPLTGYHYFYDFLVSRFALIFHFSPEDLYFRFFPLFISLLYGGSFYLISSAFTKEKIRRAVIVFFAYFSSGFPLASFPMLSQSLELIIDPSIILSVAILLNVFFFMPRIAYSLKYGFIVGVMLGILSQLKVYAGIDGIFGLLVYGFFLLFKKKESLVSYVIALIMTLVITVITYFPNNSHAGSLVFAPLLFYEHFMEQSYFNLWQWKIKKIIYMNHHNYVRIFQLYIQAIVAVWLVSLGPRILIVTKAIDVVKKKFWANISTVLIFSAILINLIVASFFIQSISVFDTVQFFWLILILLNIPAGLLWGKILTKGNAIVREVSLIILIALCAPQFFSQEKEYLLQKPLRISKNDSRLFGTIAKVIPQRSFILLIPPVNNNTIIWPDSSRISAMTGRSVYYENEQITYDNLNSIYIQREHMLIRLNHSLSLCSQEEVRDEITYIGSKYIIVYDSSPCISTNSGVLRTIRSDTMSFYEFK